MAAPKMDWIVLIADHENALQKRMAARPDHIDGLEPRINSGMWVMGGATLERMPVGGEPNPVNGSCVVARASSKEEIMEELKKDVYAQRGIWNLDKVIMYPLATAFRTAM